MRKAMISIAVSAVAAAGVAAGAVAAEVKLPKNLSWTAYGTTSSGYAQSVGLGNMLKAKYGTEVRIIPGKNDVSRMLPLKAGQAELCACGIAAYFSGEGVLMFADEKWGPQPLRNLFNNNGRHGTISAAIADDVGVKSLQDLKGKRVAWVKGSPALQTNMTSILAFAGLTWEDVVKVEVPGYGQSMQAILDGQADVAMGSSISSIYNQIAASPRGLFVPNFPHSDKEAWARMNKVAPYAAKTKVELAINGENNPSGKLPYEGAGYAYPIFVSLARVSDDVAYGLTKAVMDNYESFKDAGPGMDGYKVEKQNFQWAFPYHSGAIQYYKEAGVWTAEDQAHTDMLLKREMILANAWKKTKSEGFSSAKWLANRSAALKAAGMDAPFSE